MAIQFRCPGCRCLLRVAEDAAGKQAKCPQCSTILIVPAAPAPPPPAPDAPDTMPWETGPPAGPAAPAPSAAPMPAGKIRPVQLDLGDIFSRTWTILQRQLGMCLLATLVVLCINLAVAAIPVVIRIALVVGRAPAAMQLLVGVPVQLACQALEFWLSLGQGLLFLKLARGEHGQLSDLFTGGPFFLKALGAAILLALLVLAGGFCCVVPGIILAIAFSQFWFLILGGLCSLVPAIFLSLMFSQFWYLILDRNVDIIDSLRLSKDLTQGNKLTLFAIWLLAVLAALLAFGLTCGLGLLVVIPFIALMHAVIYLALTGQPTAAGRSGPPPRAKPPASSLPPPETPDWL